MSNIHENAESPRGMGLASKLALLAAALGVLMTGTFTVLIAVQMRTGTTANYHHTLESIARIRENLLLQQFSHVEEMAALATASQVNPLSTGVESGHATQGRFVPDQDVADSLAKAEGRGAQQAHRLLEGNSAELPLGIQLVFLDKRSVVLAPEEWRTKELPVPISAGHLAQASISRRAYVWHGEGGSYLYRVFYFAPQEWYVVCFMPMSTLEEALARRIRQTLGTGFFLTMLGVLLAYLFGGRLTASLCALNRAARVLPTLDLRTDILLDNAAEKSPASQRGVHASHSALWASPAVSPLSALPLTRHDEVGMLARSFDRMVQQLQVNTRQMLALGQEQARLQGDLQWVRTIQDGMLPREFPSHSTLDMHGCLLPAREGGGDFYDAFMLNDSLCCFAVGTVRHKGVPAAVAMSKILSLTRSLVRQSATDMPPVAAVLSQVNAALCREKSCPVRASMILGVFDCITGVMTWANAGHAAPARFCPIDVPVGHVLRAHLRKQRFRERMRARVEVLPTRQEMLLGSIEDVEYSTLTYTLNSGDRIVMYTDGVTEALREDGRRFGSPPKYFEGLPMSASAMNWFIIKRVQMFVAGAPQPGDITLLNFFWRCLYR